MAEEVKEEKLRAGKVLANIVKDVYREAFEAKERGEKIGWCASNFPQEIPTTLGLHTVYPESQAAAISAKGGALPLLEHTEGELGFSNDLCAYARISLAYADLAKCPNGEMEMPLPDFVLCCNNICDCMMKWYEDLGRKLNIPVIMIDIPFNDKYDVDQKRIDYVKGQFYDAVHQLEDITGKKWDEDKFQEVCAYSNRVGKAWLEATTYMGYKPSPLNGFELFNHMAVATMARGHEGAAEAFEQLIDEYRDNVANGTSNFHAEETHRIMFEGIACWPYLRATSHPLKETGTNVTACVYGPSFAFTYDNMDELAEAYCNVPNAINLERATELREQLCVDGKVDGGLVHINRSCKMWSGIAPEMGRRIARDLDIPVVTFDGDQSDPRNFSEEQYKTRVEGLLEIIDSKKKGE
jgi:benzoyl-CoA reductase/2-hydroxyglutaryl-CoA dehydratase subunit BcrC/BadD/HgdB